MRLMLPYRSSISFIHLDYEACKRNILAMKILVKAASHSHGNSRIASRAVAIRRCVSLTVHVGISSVKTALLSHRQCYSSLIDWVAESIGTLQLDLHVMDGLASCTRRQSARLLPTSPSPSPSNIKSYLTYLTFMNTPQHTVRTTSQTPHCYA